MKQMECPYIADGSVKCYKTLEVINNTYSMPNNFTFREIRGIKISNYKKRVQEYL